MIWLLIITVIFCGITYTAHKNAKKFELTLLPPNFKLGNINDPVKAKVDPSSRKRKEVLQRQAGITGMISLLLIAALAIWYFFF